MTFHSLSFLKDIENTRVKNIVSLTPPGRVKQKFPLPDNFAQQVLSFRKTICRILRREDPRFLVIVGPCSIHDPASALEYGKKLAALFQELKDRVFIVMRVYFEKPRTSVGWKGLISDPHLNDSGKINEGIQMARSFLLQIAELGLPAATEFLDPIVPQYIADLISWSAIGARTTESQTHREMASGLSMPVGFKNATDGHVETAINAMRSSSMAHSFLGIDLKGITSIVSTTGNKDGHLVLRGGRQGVNYLPHQIEEAIRQLQAAKLLTSLIVDCSHANGRNLIEQQRVWESILKQRQAGCKEIVGAMMESYLVAGNQPLTEDLSALRYGLSITDPCLDWETTETLLRQV